MPDVTPATTPAEAMPPQQRAVRGAAVGLAVQAVLSLVLLGLSVTGFLGPFRPLFWLGLFGLLPWSVAFIAAVLRKARATEAYELEAAARGGGAQTIFDTEADAKPAARRLERFLRLGVPIASGLVGVLLLWFGIDALRNALDFGRAGVALARPLPVAGVLAAAGFAGFVVGYYLVGLASDLGRPTLRGAGVYLLGTVLLLGVGALAAAIQQVTGLPIGTTVAFYLIPAVLVAVGIEVLLNVVLGLYRPAPAGEATDDARPAYASRLFELAVLPGGAVRQLNEAFAYQFGFEISRSWLAQFLAKSAGALVLFGLGTLILLSCFVVIGPHQRGVVTTFGGLSDETLQPGLHLKAPWPISEAIVLDVGRTRLLVVGTHEHLTRHDAYLWTNQHTNDDGLLVVSPTNLPTNAGGDATPPVALASADMSLQWRVDPEAVHDYLQVNVNPAARLQLVAQAAFARELANRQLDAAMGSERQDVADVVADAIRQAIDGQGLGIDVLGVGLTAVRPPPGVAAQFEATVAAEQDRLRRQREGRTAAEARLAQAAGSAGSARELVQSINDLNRDEDAAVREAEVEAFARRSGGAAAGRLLEARAARWTRENAARAQTSLATELAAVYARAEGLLTSRYGLAKLRDVLADRPKIVPVTDADIEVRFESDGANFDIAGAAGLEMPTRE
jgi:regulator of protease activity HflC (stomatin/prohibitin superfamily)